MKCSAAVDEKGSRELSAPFRHIRFLGLFTAERLVKSNRTQKTWDRASKELSNGVISFKRVKKWWSYINLNKSGMSLAGKGPQHFKWFAAECFSRSNWTQKTLFRSFQELHNDILILWKRAIHRCYRATESRFHRFHSAAWKTQSRWALCLASITFQAKKKAKSSFGLAE